MITFAPQFRPVSLFLERILGEILLGLSRSVSDYHAKLHTRFWRILLPVRIGDVVSEQRLKLVEWLSTLQRLLLLFQCLADNFMILVALFVAAYVFNSSSVLHAISHSESSDVES
jgi:hypothetical protein